jgi:guanylate kinase
MNKVTRGKLVIVSGPSGAGKSSVLNRVLGECSLPLRLSVSATTRAPRPNEKDGREYRFLSHEEFERQREADQFLECMEVFGRGDWYGTLAGPVAQGLEAGDWVVLEIDVQGMQSVVERIPEAITVFLHPGSIDELETRLRKRGTEDEENLKRRLEVARKELEYLPRYRYEVINDTMDRAVQEICSILLGESEHAG